VLVPAYNEAQNIREVLSRIQATGLADEIVVVDDGSTDGTREILAEYDGVGGVRVVLHDQNQGKGAALRTAMTVATGDVMLVQDADMEYNPTDYPALLKPIIEGQAQVVYGSRLMGRTPEGMMPRSAFANRVLTTMTNVLFGNRLTDMETCYKVFRREVVEPMQLRANRFDFEPEFTAKVLKQGVRIYEVPISFNPRCYEEGKKIGAWDGVMAIWALIKYRFTD
jgi:glycosyltransferase involved in cell wall biosynthesis